MLRWTHNSHHSKHGHHWCSGVYDGEKDKSEGRVVLLIKLVGEGDVLRSVKLKIDTNSW